MFSAAILAGGQSRRMGRDKALISVNGQTLLERGWRTLDALRPTVSELFVVGERPVFHRLGLRLLADDHPGDGPLGGIATALRRANEDRVLVVACDLPCLSKQLLRAMLAEAADEDVLIPALSDGSTGIRYEPLHAIYRRSCLPAIERCLIERRLKSTAFLGDVDARVLDEDWLRARDPGLRSFINVNTPTELRAALVECQMEHSVDEVGER